MIRVKICGITNVENAQSAVYAGASAIGFIFHKKSPRCISASKARNIIDQLPPFVTPVGVFVDAKEGAVRDICRFTGITTLQFHGNEEPFYCQRFKGHKIIKAFKVSEDFEFASIKKYKVDAYLFDTFSQDAAGGTGKTFNWNLMKYEKIERPFILSGGLNSSNVQEALQVLQPYAVDVSSGVEKAPGIKDPKLVRAFIDAVNSTHSAQNG